VGLMSGVGGAKVHLLAQGVAKELQTGDVSVIVSVFIVALDGREGGEEQLSDIGEGQSVASVDALAGQLLHELAEEAIDGLGSSEGFAAREELSRYGIGISKRRLLFALVEVERAERIVAGCREHTTVAAARADELAMRSESCGYGG
jgi:hypothetical protein